MADSKSIEFEGFWEFKELLDELEEDFGPKDSKLILRKGMRHAMQSVLQKAKILAPIDTGALAATLQVEARKPNTKDKRSQYVSATDTAIALVTTKAFPKKLRSEFYANNKSLFESDKAAYKTAFRKFAKENLRFYDARAIAVEFGTAKMAGKPFMRPAMESSTETVLQSLGSSVKMEIEKYKARKARRAAKGKV